MLDQTAVEQRLNPELRSEAELQAVISMVEPDLVPHRITVSLYKLMPNDSECVAPASE